MKTFELPREESQVQHVQDFTCPVSGETVDVFDPIRSVKSPSLAVPVHVLTMLTARALTLPAWNCRTGETISCRSRASRDSREKPKSDGGTFFC